MEATRSSETSIITRALLPNLPEYGILQFGHNFREHTSTHYRDHSLNDSHGNNHGLIWDSRRTKKYIITWPKYKQTPWPLVRKRTIPTEWPPLVDEIYCQLLWIEGCRVVSAAGPLRSLISVFYTGAATFFQVAPQLLSQGLSESHSWPTATQKIW
jgi:hypothetical protein